MKKVTGKLAPKNNFTEKQQENYYSNVNNALVNATTLINSKPIYEDLMYHENGVTIKITIDLKQATK